MNITDHHRDRRLHRHNHEFDREPSRLSNQRFLSRLRRTVAVFRNTHAK